MELSGLVGVLVPELPVLPPPVLPELAPVEAVWLRRRAPRPEPDVAEDGEHAEDDEPDAGRRGRTQGDPEHHDRKEDQVDVDRAETLPAHTRLSLAPP